MMWRFNQLLNELFDLVMWPCKVISPWPGLILASLVTAVLVVLFRISSNQAAIRRTRNKFLARSLELLMFQHDLSVSLTACGRIFTANFAYLFQFLLPMAVGLIPLLLIFAQLECWFERRPLIVGEQAVLTVELDPAHAVVNTPVQLLLSNTLRVDSTAVRIPSTNELAWRIVAIAPGSGWADVKVADVTERKSVVTGEDLVRVSTRRESRGLIAEMLSPSEVPLDTVSPVRRMLISYPAREISLGQTEISWFVAAIGLMLVSSLLLGRLFGVSVA